MVFFRLNPLFQIGVKLPLYIQSEQYGGEHGVYKLVDEVADMVVVVISVGHMA